MDQANSARTSEDILIQLQMEKMVGTYDKYMNRITLGREKKLRQMTVDLAQIEPGSRLFRT